MKIVEITGLLKKFGSVAAVDHINLEIEEGEIFGFLGPNGAGKSTTIHLICGLLSPDKGKVAVLGREVKRQSSFTKRNTGIVPQDIAIYEDLTAYENIHFFAGLYGLRGHTLKERVAEALDFVGLTDQAKNFPANFSGGMKRRLNIACALAHHPRLMIMDEPTVGIDPQSRNHILQSVKQLNALGCTIIYTSHYMEEVEELCSKAVIMDHGKIIAKGSITDLKATIADTNNVWITVDSVRRVDEAKLREITGVISVELGENLVKINSANDANNLDRIIAHFIVNQVPIKNIENKTPDLETVFLNLTGRKLRD